MTPPRLDRIRHAEQRRDLERLLDRSSLRDREALAARAEYERQQAERLTGMPEEQADWDEEADDCSKCQAVLGGDGRCWYCDGAAGRIWRDE